MASLTPEKRSTLTRATGIAAARRVTADERRAAQLRGVATRKARGPWMTDEQRAAMSNRVRTTGQSAAGARAAHAKYGDQHPGVLALRTLVQSMKYRDWMRL